MPKEYFAIIYKDKKDSISGEQWTENEIERIREDEIWQRIQYWRDNETKVSLYESTCILDFS